MDLTIHPSSPPYDAPDPARDRAYRDPAGNLVRVQEPRSGTE